MRAAIYARVSTTAGGLCRVSRSWCAAPPSQRFCEKVGIRSRWKPQNNRTAFDGCMTLCPRPVLGFVFSLLMKQVRTLSWTKWLQP